MEESTHKVEVNIKRHSPRAIILRVEIAAGEIDGEKFDVSYGTNGSPVWYFSTEGRYYSIDIKELTGKVIEVKQKVNKEGGMSDK